LATPSHREKVGGYLGVRRDDGDVPAASLRFFATDRHFKRKSWRAFQTQRPMGKSMWKQVTEFFTSSKDVFSALTSLFGLSAFVFAAWQYHINQVWRRNQFLAAEIKDFLGDQFVKESVVIFDVSGATIEAKVGGKNSTISVFHEGPVPHDDLEKHNFHITLSEALRKHEGRGLNEVEIAVRDRIDRYFSYLERLYIFQQNKLFKKSEIFPFLSYQLALLNGERKSAQGYHKQLRIYLEKYGFLLAIKFLDDHKKKQSN
jgi:hypothetical protein